MSRDNDIALIEQYLNNELTQEERQLVDQRIDEDREFHHLFNLQKVLMGKAFPETRLLEQVELATAESRKAKQRKTYYAIAATVSIVLVAIVFLLNPEGSAPVKKLGFYGVEEAQQTELGFAGTGVIIGEEIAVSVVQADEHAYFYSDELIIYWPSQEDYRFDGVYYLPETNTYRVVFERDTFELFKSSQKLPFKMD